MLDSASSTMKVCAVIPVFNHSQFVGKVFQKIQKYELFCIVVNDGSTAEDTEVLRALFQNNERARLVERAVNGGKGAAVHDGMRIAEDLGFTHVIQVDADGQHNIEDIHRLLELAQTNPDALITGVPLYDESVPRTRLISRYITHFWVWVETLSFSIKDSMCGFRVYPLAQTLPLLNERIGKRMDFDTQIMVRMYWRGTQVISMPTKVIYPEDGVSNFRLLRDNIRISWMHTRLFFGMIVRLPVLLARKFKPGRPGL